jgi:hypothetical protein
MSQKSGSTVRPGGSNFSQKSQQVVAELRYSNDRMAAEMAAMKQKMHDQLAYQTRTTTVVYYEQIWMAGANEVTRVPVLLLAATACLVLVQCWDQEVT